MDLFEIAKQIVRDAAESLRRKPETERLSAGARCLAISLGLDPPPRYRITLSARCVVELPGGDPGSEEVLRHTIATGTRWALLGGKSVV